MENNDAVTFLPMDFAAVIPPFRDPNPSFCVGVDIGGIEEKRGLGPKCDLKPIGNDQVVGGNERSFFCQCGGSGENESELHEDSGILLDLFLFC